MNLNIRLSKSYFATIFANSGDPGIVLERITHNFR